MTLADDSTRVTGPGLIAAQLITTLRGLAEGPSQSSSTPANAMLAGFSAHHEPFYRALRDHRMAIS
ncbi:MAG TPA: hypothetical protein VIL16_15260 [Trebonia sp.]